MLRKERRLSQSQLASALNISKSAIAMYETNERMPKKEVLEAIADFFNVDMNFLYGKTHVRNSSVELDDMPSIIPSSAVTSLVPLPDLSEIEGVPVLGESACGSPLLADRVYEYVKLKRSIKADFALIANGNSMTGCGIMNGSLVLFEETPTVDNGTIAAITVEDSTTIKKYYRYGDTVVLRPCNPDFEDQEYSGEELEQIHVFGKLVCVITEF